MKEAIVAGAGVWGCTVAHVLAEAGIKVLVLEKRSVVGGNCRCEIDEKTGIEIHKYGSHIFHTSDMEVWHFVNRFTSFNGYQHKVLAHHNGKTYFLPLGLTLINKFFGVELTPDEVPEFMRDKGHEEDLFNAFFRNYTSKQWGRPPEEIDPSIIKRVPVRTNYDTNYFTDYLQGIPTDGYNALFDRMLDHPNITVKTESPFQLSDWQNDKNNYNIQAVVFYSGPIDALFNYKFGPLSWRSLRFELERISVSDAQGTSVINYVDADVPFTRIHEYKHYHPEKKQIMSCQETIICREYPKAWEMGDEPYYPVNTPENTELLEKYHLELKKIPNLVVGGRLGLYRYFDIDKAIKSALKSTNEFLRNQNLLD